jgi:hypothetical protein
MSSISPIFYLEDHPNQHFESISEKIESGYKNLENMNIDANFIIKDTFFSAKNIDLIQRWIIKEIIKETKIKISYQKIEHLLLIMNSIYSIYAKNLPYNLKEQIYDLDKKVVNECKRLIIVELISYSKYIDTINSANYIDLPIYIINNRKSYNN